MLLSRSWDKNMDINLYKIVITPTAYKEMNKIYDYITDNLYAENAAKRLMRKVEEEVEKLKTMPKIHTKIEKVDGLKRTYRRIIVRNYVLLYTIDEKNKTVFVSHMYYGRKNYIDKNFYI